MIFSPRLGGDEFAICFFSSQSAQFIGRIEEIQKNFIDSPQDFNGTAVSCYFSYGIAHCPEDGETYDVLINTADSRMYEMKALLKGQNKKMISRSTGSKDFDMKIIVGHSNMIWTV